MTVPLFDRKRDSFLLWCPSATAPAPKLIIGRFSPGNPPKLADYGTPNPHSAAAEYRVPNWPVTPPGRKWKEITQERDVPMEWVGREPIYPWEAKVYALVDG